MTGATQVGERADAAQEPSPDGDEVVVVDASSLTAYLLGLGTEVERSALRSDAHAPSLLDLEVTQTLRGLLRATKIGVDVARQARVDLQDVALYRHLDTPLLGRAWELRDRCTIYDGLYVALAEALGARLVTRDDRLARSVGDLVRVAVSR